MQHSLGSLSPKPHTLLPSLPPCLPGPPPNTSHYHSTLITKTAGLSPSQVRVEASANFSIGVRLSGAQLAANPGATVKALRTAFADLALGYDPSLVQVSPVPPPPGMVVLPGSTAGANPVLMGRRRVLLGSTYRSTGEVGAWAGVAGGMGMREVAGGSFGVVGGRRRLAQASQAGSGSQSDITCLLQATGAEPQWGNTAFATFWGLSPGALETLMRAVQMSCGNLVAGRKLPGR